MFISIEFIILCLYFFPSDLWILLDNWINLVEQNSKLNDTSEKYLFYC